MDMFPSFVVSEVAKKLSGDELTLGVFKLFATGVIDPFKVLDRVNDPIKVASFGQLNFVEWLFPFMTEDEDEKTKKGMFHIALWNYRKEVMIWLVENGCPVDDHDVDWLISQGHADVLRALVIHSQDPSDLGTTPCNSAAFNGDIILMIWLHENGCPWDEGTCANAADGGHLDCLVYLHEHGCPWDERVCRYSVEKGNMNCLVYACENGCPFTEETSEAAVDRGEIEYLVYLRKKGCPWYGNACLLFARSGNLDCLSYANKDGCSWDENTCRTAAYNGNLRCLMYARVNGCPWDANTCTSAAEGGHIECLMYAHWHGCPWDENLIVSARLALDDAEDNDQIENIQSCIAFAIENGCPGGDL
jgi:hypothetical protein